MFLSHPQIKAVSLPANQLFWGDDFYWSFCWVNLEAAPPQTNTMIPTRWGMEKRGKSLSQNQNLTLLKGTLTCENIAGFNKKTPKTQ